LFNSKEKGAGASRGPETLKPLRAIRSNAREADRPTLQNNLNKTKPARKAPPVENAPDAFERKKRFPAAAAEKTAAGNGTRREAGQPSEDLTYAELKTLERQKKRIEK